MNADQQGIVPLALAHNLDACLAYSLLISRSHRQIGNIDGQILSLSAYRKLPSCGKVKDIPVVVVGAV